MACSFICKSEVYGASQFLWAMTQTPIEGQWGMTRGPPVSARCSSLCCNKEHSREMALVKDWHWPLIEMSIWIVVLWDEACHIAVDETVEGLGLLTGVGGQGQVTIWWCWEPLPSHRSVQTVSGWFVLLYFILYGKLSFALMTTALMCFTSLP